MFNIYGGTDLSQLMLGRSLRNQNSLLFLIKGVDNLSESVDFIKHYSSKCDLIYYNKIIEKPTYDETNSIMSSIRALNSFSYENVKFDVSVLFNSLGEKENGLLVEAIFAIFREVNQFNSNPSTVKNAYIRCMNILKNRFQVIVNKLSEENSILYVGKPDKYDILAFTVLGLCGVDTVICDFTPTQTSECLCMNRFVLIQGGEHVRVDLSFLSYANQGIKHIDEKTVFSNNWVDFTGYTTLDDYLKLANFDYKNRFEKNKWKVLNLCINGVNDEQSYSSMLDNFKINTTALGRKFELFDGSISNATYEESDKHNREVKGIEIIDLFARYPLFSGSGIPIQIDKTIKEIESTCGLKDSKLKNYMSVLKIWLVRYLDKFYSGNSLSELPLIICYGNMDTKEKDFLKILGLLPLDIIYFNPDFVKNILNNKDIKCYDCGKSTNSIPKYPTNVGVGQVATLAYNTERELDTILYSDTSLFRVKQFKKVNPIVLKTTYEEVSILWNEPAKFRPSFESAGDLVTVPTIFTKVNGVTPTYKEDIIKLFGKNVMLYNRFPIDLQSSKIDSNGDLRSFVKQIVFKDEIDYARLIKSPYYTYSVYSEETQALIQEKVDKLIHTNWCSSGDKNLVYDILDTVYRLPNSILQAIHNYDFTADIPKLIIYNGGNTPCTLSDCIVIMFLKLIGFDVVIFTPTGYRVVEQYINSQWFNEITVGQFDFNLENLDFSNSVSSTGKTKKRGLFGLFG